MYFKLLRTNLIIGMHGILAFIIKKNVADRSSGSIEVIENGPVRAGLRFTKISKLYNCAKHLYL